MILKVISKHLYIFRTNYFEGSTASKFTGEENYYAIKFVVREENRIIQTMYECLLRVVVNSKELTSFTANE